MRSARSPPRPAARSDWSSAASGSERTPPPLPARRKACATCRDHATSRSFRASSAVKPDTQPVGVQRRPRGAGDELGVVGPDPGEGVAQGGVGLGAAGGEPVEVVRVGGAGAHGSVPPRRGADAAARRRAGRCGPEAEARPRPRRSRRPSPRCSGPGGRGARRGPARGSTAPRGPAGRARPPSPRRPASRRRTRRSRGPRSARCGGRPRRTRRGTPAGLPRSTPTGTPPGHRAGRPAP